MRRPGGASNVQSAMSFPWAMDPTMDALCPATMEALAARDMLYGSVSARTHEGNTNGIL